MGWREDRDERALWRDTHSLRDVGEVNAEWLRGTVGWRPGYGGLYDETEQILDPLVELNHAGLVTHCSQPGIQDQWDEEYGYSLTQRAFVAGAADAAAAARLRDESERQGWLYRGQPAGELGFRSDRGDEDSIVDITWENGHWASAMGGWPSRREWSWRWRGVGREARSALRDATLVEVIDMQAGRNTMWDGLIRAVRGQAR